MHNQSIIFTCKQCLQPFSVAPWRAKANPLFCKYDCRRAWNVAQGKVRITHVCEQCGTEFTDHPSANKRFCTMACKGIASQKNEKRTCEHCSKEFACKASSLLRFCSTRCAGKATGYKVITPSQIRICEHCSKEFTWTTRSRSAVRFCSRACINAAINGPRKSEFITKACDHCSKEFSYYAAHFANPRKYCSIKCAKIHNPKVGADNPQWKPKIELICEICGKHYFTAPSKAERSHTCSRRCHSARLVILMPHISSIEIKLRDALLVIGLKPVPQYPIQWCVVDLAFPEQHLAIECDGDYWHASNQQKAKDRQKDHCIKREGWRILRLTEHQINSSLDDCVQLIVNCLNTH